MGGTLEAGTKPERFRLLVATRRDAVLAFFTDLPRRGLPELVVERLGVDDARTAYAACSAATAVVVDLEAGAADATELCLSLRARMPTLAILAVACCPQALNPVQLQAVIDADVSVLDLGAATDDAVRTLRGIARGESVLRLHLAPGQRAYLLEAMKAQKRTSAAKTELLGLVALGLPDHEIGRRVHLSPHTVKHHVERLREEIGVRNRIELAAWAGRHGFYEQRSDRPAKTRPTSPVHARVPRTKRVA